MSDKRPKVEFVDNPNPIAKKIRVEQGRDPKTLIQKADQAVRKLGGEFEEIFQQNVAEISKSMSELKKGGDGQSAALIEMRKTLHDLRGQAGTFGYPLVSHVGDSACKFIDHSETVSANEIEVLNMHVDALKAISAAKIKGDGGDVGKELMNGLRKVIVKYNAANST
ncbi:MAG: Hpt domain-containing protein [Alphaproteobacteria bacterium]|nr:Hpt domain-containing protein [Alphaproteobacteria bacterium]